MATAPMSVAVRRLLAPFSGCSLLYTEGPDDGYEVAGVVKVANQLNDCFPFDIHTSIS